MVCGCRAEGTGEGAVFRVPFSASVSLQLSFRGWGLCSSRGGMSAGSAESKIDGRCRNYLVRGLTTPFSGVGTL